LIYQNVLRRWNKNIMDINTLIREEANNYLVKCLRKEIEIQVHDYFTKYRMQTIDIVREALIKVMSETDAINICIKRVIQEMAEKELETRIKIHIGI